MSFIDQRLPMEVEIDAVRREIETIEMVRTDGGHEVRNARHSQGRFEYDVSFPAGSYNGTVIKAVKDMFKASRGGLYAFRFRDWDPENSRLPNETIGTGDGATTAFQMTRTWTIGGMSQVRNITLPVDPLVIKLDGVSQASGYSVDYATGVLAFSVAPAAGVVISVIGDYDIPVRFDMSFQATGMASFLEHIDTLTLVEVLE